MSTNSGDIIQFSYFKKTLIHKKQAVLNPLLLVLNPLL